MLSIGVTSGLRINVGDHIVEVKKIVSPHLMLVSVDGGEAVVVSNQKREEIIPQVFVQTGAKDDACDHRLAFDAPRSIKIGPEHGYGNRK